MGGMPEDIHTNFVIEGTQPATPPVSVDQDDADDGPPPLWKQGLGAVVGSLVALALYSAYEAAAPTVTGWLSGEEKHAAAQEHNGEPATVKKVSTGARQKRESL